ncbi:hypothetical protein [Lentzea sp. NEAU-D7]|uniref:hypothetical protein n=1 Tax=Lentzea sp. NEAU-D7 TaxID=2994667 RepID=UPI00224B8AB2|nr:hypothetical protein [Lentzea sp. NEAU-D7]MCX2950745.1 hypothetical protein [Lentzea sp. NEAU-D7]
MELVALGYCLVVLLLAQVACSRANKSVRRQALSPKQLKSSPCVSYGLASFCTQLPAAYRQRGDGEQPANKLAELLTSSPIQSQRSNATLPQNTTTDRTPAAA